MWWTEWWFWGAAAFGLIILEILLPTYIFLGFGIGAGITAFLLWLGGAIAATLTSSLSLLLAVFAVISLLAWVALRWLLGTHASQVKTFEQEHDINDN